MSDKGQRKRPPGGQAQEDLEADELAWLAEAEVETDTTAFASDGEEWT